MPAILTPPAPLTAEQIERLHAMVKRTPRRMTPSLARELDVAESEVIRHLPGNASIELDIQHWEPLIRSFETLGKVHVICNSGTVVLESYGVFGNFSTWGEYFNVQTKIDMHIRFAELGSVFAVEKLSHTDGAKTYSFQFYTIAGDCAFKVFVGFGGQEPEPERIAQVKMIIQQFKAA